MASAPIATGTALTSDMEAYGDLGKDYEEDFSEDDVTGESSVEAEEEDALREEYEGSEGSTSSSEERDDVENIGALSLAKSPHALRPWSMIEGPLEDEGEEPNFLSDSDIEVTHDAALKDPLAYEGGGGAMNSEDERDRRLLKNMMRSGRGPASERRRGPWRGEWGDLFPLHEGDSLYFIDAAQDEEVEGESDGDADAEGSVDDSFEKDGDVSEWEEGLDGGETSGSASASASGDEYYLLEDGFSETDDDGELTAESIESYGTEEGSTTDSLDSDDHEGLARFGIEVSSEESEAESANGHPTASMYELQAPTAMELMTLAGGDAPGEDDKHESTSAQREHGHDTDETLSDVSDVEKRDRSRRPGKSASGDGRDDGRDDGRRGAGGSGGRGAGETPTPRANAPAPAHAPSVPLQTPGKLNPLEHSLRYGVVTPEAQLRAPSPQGSMRSPTMGVFSSSVPGGFKRSRTLVIDPTDKLPPSPFPRRRSRKRARTDASKKAAAPVSRRSPRSPRHDEASVGLSDVLNPWMFVHSSSESSSESEEVPALRQHLSRWERVPMGAFRSAGGTARRGQPLESALRGPPARRDRRPRGTPSDLFAISPVLLPQ